MGEKALSWSLVSQSEWVLHGEDGKIIGTVRRTFGESTAYGRVNGEVIGAYISESHAKAAVERAVLGPSRP